MFDWISFEGSYFVKKKCLNPSSSWPPNYSLLAWNGSLCRWICERFMIGKDYWWPCKLRLFLESSSGCSVFDLNQIFLELSFLVERFWAPLLSVIKKNPIPLGQFQLRITNPQDKCFSEISYFTMWMWTRRGTPSRTSQWSREPPKIKISRSSCIIYLYPEFFILCKLIFRLKRLLFLSIATYLILWNCVGILIVQVSQSSYASFHFSTLRLIFPVLMKLRFIRQFWRWKNLNFQNAGTGI